MELCRMSVMLPYVRRASCAEVVAGSCGAVGLSRLITGVGARVVVNVRQSG